MDYFSSEPGLDGAVPQSEQVKFGKSITISLAAVGQLERLDDGAI